MNDTMTSLEAKRLDPMGAFRIIDLSITLDARNFRMRTYAGFKKDMQFETEVIKDYPGGLGQIVRGVHMRLHAGTHVDAPAHFTEGAPHIHEMPLERFIGPAVIADVRHRTNNAEITPADLEAAVGDRLQKGDRLLLRTDQNKEYDASPEWMAQAPHLGEAGVDWCLGRGCSIVGFDFYHGNNGDHDPNYLPIGRFSQNNVMTMPYLTNLGAVTAPRFLLVSLPLKMIDVEASPIRAVALVPAAG